MHRRSFIPRMVLAACFLFLFPLASFATMYSASTWYEGHEAAADSCIIEFAPDFSVTDVRHELATAGWSLRQLSMLDGTLVEADDFDALALYKGDEIAIGVVDVDPATDLAAQLEELRDLPGVRDVAPNYIHRVLMTPNDPYYSSQQGNFRQIYVNDAWDIATGQGATVAVIDTGYRKTGMTDPAKNLLTGYDFWGNDSNVQDYIGHGTHVSNTVAENTNNGKGCAGIAYNAKLMPLKVFPDYDQGALESDILSAINYAVSNGADVINMSLGGGGYVSSTNNAINNAVSHDVVVVAASGNEYAGTVDYPAAYENCIAVGATNRHSVGANPSRADFSNYGSALDISAPGVDIVQEAYEPTWGVGFYSFGGTSMASPHIAGVAALLVEHGGADASGIRQAMCSTARSSSGVGKWTSQLGYGEVDAYAALVEYAGVNQPPTAVAKATPTKGSAPLKVIFDGTDSKDSDGKIVQYTWRYKQSNDLVGTGKTLTYTFHDTGTYNIVLTVKDNQGATATDTVQIVITPGSDDDDDDTGGDDDTGDDYDFDNSDCGKLLQTIYNKCDLSLVYENGQNISPASALTMCENSSGGSNWECMQSCYDQVDNCDDMEACVTEHCSVQLADDSSSDDDSDSSADDNFLWGCGS